MVSSVYLRFLIFGKTNNYVKFKNKIKLKKKKEICMQVRKQQLELDMKEQTGSK